MLPFARAQTTNPSASYLMKNWTERRGPGDRTRVPKGLDGEEQGKRCQAGRLVDTSTPGIDAWPPNRLGGGTEPQQRRHELPLETSADRQARPGERRRRARSGLRAARAPHECRPPAPASASLSARDWTCFPGVLSVKMIQKVRFCEAAGHRHL